MMITLVKIILGITLSFWSVQNPKRDLVQNYVPSEPMYMILKDSTQQRAFGILVDKCNVCHAQRNRGRVFTEDNMNSWTNDIYQQVFIEKRMPKGKKTKLTSQEYQDLLTWVSYTKTQNNGI